MKKKVWILTYDWACISLPHFIASNDASKIKRVTNEKKKKANLSVLNVTGVAAVRLNRTEFKMLIDRNNFCLRCDKVYHALTKSGHVLANVKIWVIYITESKQNPKSGQINLRN